MRRCDGIVLVPGWNKSKGAMAEVEIALKSDLPVMRLDELIDLDDKL